MPDGDIFEINIDGTIANQNVCNVHHFVQIGSDGTGDARTALHVLWQDTFEPVFLPCLASAYDLVQSRTRRIQPTETQSLVAALAGSGSDIAEPLPTQTCAILRQYGIPAGRKGTGHVKLSPLPITEVEDGRISVAQAILMDTYGDEMIVDQTEVGSGYVFRSGVYSLVDNVLRKIQRYASIGPVKTCYSRSIGTGS